MKLALAIVATSSVALADPPSAVAPTPAPTPAPAPETTPLRCTPGFFLEPMLGRTKSGVFHRLSAGYEYRTCDWGLAAGINGAAAATHENGGTGGVGVNVEPSLRTSDTTRLGLFLSYNFDEDHRHLYTAEARFHINDGIFLDGGVYRVTPGLTSDLPPESGAVFGIGVEGRPGWYIGGGELVLAGIAFVLIAAAGGISG